MHLGSVQELLAKEREAREDHANEVKVHLADEKAQREKLPDTLKSVMDAKIKDHHVSLGERIADLEQLLKHEQGTREADLHELRELVGGTKLTHEGHLGSVKELLAKERQTREMHLGSVQELLAKEREAREDHANEVKVHLA